MRLGQVNPAWWNGNVSQGAMRSVAKRRVCGGFALAEVEARFFRNLQLLRLQAGSLMGAVAERAVACSTAGTPPVGSRFQLNPDWLRVAAYGSFRHGRFSDFPFLGTMR